MSMTSIVAENCPEVVRKMFARLKSRPGAYRLSKGIFWSLMGAVLSRSTMLVAALATARILRKTSYGELGMIQSTVATLGIFAGFGLGMTATKHVAEYRTTDPKRAGRIVALSGLFAATSSAFVAIGLVLFAPWLANYTINAPQLAGELRIGALILFFSAINGAQTGALTGLEAFKTTARVNFYSGLIACPMIVGGALLGGLTGAVWGMSLNLAATWLLFHLALRKEMSRFGIPMAIRGCMAEWPVLWHFSLPAVLAASMAGPVNWACNALLVNHPGGYAENAILTAANQWFNLLLYPAALVGNVLLPILSEAHGKGAMGKTLSHLVLAIKITAIVVLPMAILGSLASPWIMWTYGPGFREGWPTLAVCMFTAALLATMTPIGNLISATGRMWLGFYMNTGWAVVYLACTYWLVDYGSIGLASARGIAYLVHSLWTFGFMAYMLKKPAAAVPLDVREEVCSGS